MKKPANYLLSFLGVLFLVTGSQAYAIPTLFFDGETNYDAGTGMLTIDAVLMGSIDIAPPPVLSGSSMTLSALFSSENSSDGITSGFFGTALAVPDLSIVDGGAITLLEGDILDLLLTGADGLDFGILAGNFSPTAGSLFSDFTDPSGIFALELNLTTVFGAGMFDENFSGQSDGRVSVGEAVPPDLFPPSGIPEPDTLVLLVLSRFGLVARQMYLKRRNLHS